MAAELQHLNPEFLIDVKSLLPFFSNEGYTLRRNESIRSLFKSKALAGNLVLKNK